MTDWCHMFKQQNHLVSFVALASNTQELQLIRSCCHARKLRAGRAGYVLLAGDGTTRTHSNLYPLIADHPRLSSGNASRGM